MDRKPILNVKSLKEQVSEYPREQTRRGALESMALLRAFDKLKAPDIEGRQALNGGMRRSIEANECDAYDNQNRAFHNTVLMPCGNESLIKTINRKDFPGIEEPSE